MLQSHSVTYNEGAESSSNSGIHRQRRSVNASQFKWQPVAHVLLPTRMRPIHVSALQLSAQDTPGLGDGIAGAYSCL